MRFVPEPPKNVGKAVVRLHRDLGHLRGQASPDMAQTASVREGVLHRQTSWLAAKFLCLAGLGFKQRRQKKLEELFARRVLGSPSWEFEYLFEARPIEFVYGGTPVGS